MIRDQMTPEEMTFAVAWRTADPSECGLNYTYWWYVDAESVPWDQMAEGVKFQETADPGITDETVFGPMHYKTIFPPPITTIAIHPHEIEVIYAICRENTTNNREEVVINS